MTARINTSQDYLNFLMVVLQKVEENPNPQSIYPFLSKNLNKLDENLLKLLLDKDILVLLECLSGDMLGRMAQQQEDAFGQITILPKEFLAIVVGNFGHLLSDFTGGMLLPTKKLLLLVIVLL